jgi:hypothetical protein
MQGGDWGHSMEKWSGGGGDRQWRGEGVKGMHVVITYVHSYVHTLAYPDLAYDQALSTHWHIWLCNREISRTPVMALSLHTLK